MKTIKVLVTAVCFFALQTAGAQDGLKIGTYGNGDKMIYISLGNLLKIAQMTNVEFERNMETYNYKYTEGYGYLWQGGGLMAGYYSISKDPGFAGMIWTEKNIMVAELKDELEQYFKGYSGDKYLYEIQTSGSTYQIILRTKDDGSGSVSIKRF